MPATIGQALVAAAGSPRGVRFIEHDGRTAHATYHDVLQGALRIGGALQRRGLAAGDRVALVVSEVEGFVHAFFGIVAAGLVPVPLCPPAQAGDLATFTQQSRHILTASRAAALITTADVAPLMQLGSAQDVPLVLLLEEISGGEPLPEPVHVSTDAAAILQYTSGSTAMPKGVVLSHANIAANIEAILGPSGLQARAGDVGVSWLPLYHDMGLIGMLLSSVFAREDIVILSPVLFLKRPSAWLDAIATYRGTVSFAPNFAYELCRRRVKPSQIDALDLSSWRVAGCGAEPIQPGTLLQFAEHFARAGFKESSFLPCYGLAEHSLAVSFGQGGLQVDVVDAGRLVHESRAVPAVNGSPSVRVVCCGGALPRHEIRIVTESLEELPERHVGAIAVKGPSIMQAYFDDPEATADAVRDGWLMTGDLGYVASGSLYVCGRTKDLIIRQGRKYHPADLEASLTDLTGVALAGVVVFGIHRLEGSDEVVAVLETRAAGRAADIESSVRRRIRETSGLELDRVVLAPPGTIPRTTSGKVRRSEARARLEAGTLTR
jgi:fatty-acyl-CoA synthase